MYLYNIKYYIDNYFEFYLIMVVNKLMKDKLLFSLQYYWVFIIIIILIFGMCFFELFRNHAVLLNRLVYMVIWGSFLDKLLSILVFFFYVVVSPFSLISVSLRIDIYDSKIIKLYFFGLLETSTYKMNDLKAMKIKDIETVSMNYHQLLLIFNNRKIHFNSTLISFSSAYYYLTDKYKDKMMGEGWWR